MIKLREKSLITVIHYMSSRDEMIKLEIPEDILKDVDIKDPSQIEEILRIGIKQMKIEKALHSYKEGKISIAKAAELADISLSEMTMQASARGLKPLYDKKMVEEETQ
jgi:predicted HTH domain antitoxin